MKEPSEARQRTLELHDRAIAFSNNINHPAPRAPSTIRATLSGDNSCGPATGTSNNLIEAGDGCTDADFLHRMRTALREAKESKACLKKIRLGPPANAARVLEFGLEQEADELCAIYATIVLNVEKRLAREKAERRNGRVRDCN